MNLKVTVVRLSAQVIARIEAVAGKRRIAQFLREAAEAELSRREGTTPSHTKPKPKKKP